METAMTVACIIGLVAWGLHQGRRKGSRQGHRAGGTNLVGETCGVIDAD